MNSKINDPSNYRAMSSPFANADEANAALDAFMDEVRELRQKHRIADVLTVVCVNVDYDGQEGAAMTYGHNGDPMKAEAMAAYAYGREQAQRREMMAKLIGRGRA